MISRIDQKDSAPRHTSGQFLSHHGSTNQCKYTENMLQAFYDLLFLEQEGGFPNSSNIFDV